MRLFAFVCATSAVLPGQALTGEWTDCTNGATGLCIDTDQYKCATATLSGKCSGGSSIRCCPSTSGFTAASCTDVSIAAFGEGGALCKKTSECSPTSTVVTGKCAGPTGITCCVPTPTWVPAPSPAPTKLPTAYPTKYPTPSAPSTGSGTFVPAKPDTSQSTGPCTTPYQKFTGECIDVAKCTGGTYKGLCPGSSAVMCCVAETHGTPVQSSPQMSLATFKAVFQGISAARAEALYPYFLTALADGNISSCHEIAAFVAQIGHESVGLKYFEELASGDAYNGREDLGNTQPGDGPRFKGRGPIQLTGRANYRASGTALDMDLETRPEQVCLPSAGFKTSVWFWSSNNLNQYCTGSQSDFVTLTKRINGGTNGLDDRVARWGTAKSLLGCSESTSLFALGGAGTEQDGNGGSGGSSTLTSTAAIAGGVCAAVATLVIAAVVVKRRKVTRTPPSSISKCATDSGPRTHTHNPGFTAGADGSLAEIADTPNSL